MLIFTLGIIGIVLSIDVSAASSTYRKKRDTPPVLQSSNPEKPYPQDYIAHCLAGWYPFKNKCYKAGGLTTNEFLTWHEAAQKCKEYGGHLASIHSKEEQDFITYNILLNLKGDIWFGLNDIKNESSYVYEDGSPVDYHIWADNEPSGPKDDAEDCGEMYIGTRGTEIGKWNDANCNIRKKFVCQLYQDVNENNPNPKYCPHGSEVGYRVQNSCYYVIPKAMTWRNAEKYCYDQYNGNLVTVTDFTTQYFLLHLLKEMGIGKPAWIGLHHQPGVPLRWTSGWFMTYTNFDGTPRTQVDSCAVQLKIGFWDTEPCENLNPFVCETNLGKLPKLKASAEGGVCPQKIQKWIDIGGDFCYHFERTSWVNWMEANFHCMQKGGGLTSIHSQEELELMERFLRYSQYSYHIGLFRSLNNSFQWSDGTNVDFTAWDAREPNSVDERCGEFVVPRLAWNDSSCDKKRGYICSVRKIFPKKKENEGKSCSVSIPAAGVRCKSLRLACTDVITGDLVLLPN